MLFAAESRRHRSSVGLSALLAIFASGCCTLTQVETILAPPKADADEERELLRMATEPPPLVQPTAVVRGVLDLADAERCDVLDPSRCLLPFPNDFFTVEDAAATTGRRVRFDPESMPQNSRGKGIDPEAWHWSDGFSPGGMILTLVPDLDLAVTDAPLITDPGRSLEDDSPILLIEAETGERHLIWAELDARADDPAARALIVWPGAGLPPGKRYVVALRRLKDRDGTPIPPSRAFEVYRDRIDHGAPEIEDRRPHMEEVFGLLATAGVDRGDLYLAWDFTVASSRDASARLLHMRDDAFAALGDEAPRFEILCREKRDGDVPRRVWGSYEVPKYLRGNGGPGSRLLLSDDGLPVRAGNFKAYFSCIVPRRALEEPARIALYGHGFLNSLDEVDAGDVRAMAAEYGFVFCATNWSGLSVPDSLQVVRFLRDASEFPAVADRLHQGVLNALFLGRLMIHPDGLGSHPAFQGPGGEPLLDTRHLFYDGNSLGGVLGGVATAVAQDWTRAVLGVPGMGFSLFLQRSANYVEPSFELAGIKLPSFQQILRHSYPHPLDRQLFLALIQMLWDRAELAGHARHLTRDPYPGTPAKEVLLHEAFGDRTLVNVATEVLARNAGIHLYQPALSPGRDSRPDPHFGIPPIPELPFVGSALVVWDDGSCPTPLDNTALGKDGDPHGVVRRQESARLQKAEFLKADGRVVDVCGGEPCAACGGEPCEEICDAPP